MVMLLHTNRMRDFFLFVAVKVISGKDHECPVLYELIKQFVETMGPGVMKRLIVDRGFLDGKAISWCKKKYGIDVLIPIRRNMDLYEDAMALFREPEVDLDRNRSGNQGRRRRSQRMKSENLSNRSASLLMMHLV